MGRWGLSSCWEQISIISSPDNDDRDNLSDNAHHSQAISNPTCCCWRIVSQMHRVHVCVTSDSPPAQGEPSGTQLDKWERWAWASGLAPFSEEPGWSGTRRSAPPSTCAGTHVHYHPSQQWTTWHHWEFGGLTAKLLLDGVMDIVCVCVFLHRIGSWSDSKSPE